MDKTNPKARRSLKEKIEQTAAYMEARFAEPLTREKLAQMAGLNPEHYSRIFKKHKGQSPIDYLTERRIRAAKALLQDKEVSVREAARTVGFEDPYYFSRRFRLYAGLSPTEYRQQPQLRVVAVDYYGHLRALGIRPVGLGARMVGLTGLLADWSEDAADIGLDEPPYYDLAAIRRLQPDAVCVPVTWMRQEQSEARVVEVDDRKDPLFVQLRTIGAALGLEKRAENWLREYEDRARQLRSRLETRMMGKTIAILRVRADLLQIYGNAIMGYSLYESLGLAPPDKLSKQFAVSGFYHSTVIVLDELPFYHADYLIVVVQPDEESQRVWREIRQSGIWSSFPAVEAGQFYEVDVRLWLAYDPLSIRAQLEEAAVLLGASNRDGE